MQLGLCLIAAAAAFRAVEFAIRAAIDFQNPYEVFFLEAKFVHLAWRFAEGLPSYPAWWDYPHVPNFFGPVYAMLVGGLGRSLGTDIPTLFAIGRGVTLAAMAASALIAGIATSARWGAGAGLVAGGLMLGSASTIHFGTMARPDALADALGLLGFLLATTRRPGRSTVPLAVASLVLAVLTKQTAALYLLAAVLGLGLERRWVRSLLVGLATFAVLLLIVGGATLTVSPHFAGCLLSEARMPIDPVACRFLVYRYLSVAPETLLLIGLGLSVWLRRTDREPSLAALSLVAPLLTGLAALKVGSDYNYFLPVRSIAALGAGAWWGHAWSHLRTSERISWRPLLVLGLVLASLWPSLQVMRRAVGMGRRSHRYHASEEGRRGAAIYAQLAALASDPETELLTDSGLLALHQGRRAAFVDPWLFRELVRQGRIRPGQIQARLRSAEYDAVVSTSPLNEPGADQDIFALPPPLAATVRRRYERLNPGRNSFYLFVPKQAADLGAGP